MKKTISTNPKIIVDCPEDAIMVYPTITSSTISLGAICHKDLPCLIVGADAPIASLSHEQLENLLDTCEHVYPDLASLLLEEWKLLHNAEGMPISDEIRSEVDEIGIYQIELVERIEDLQLCTAFIQGASLDQNFAGVRYRKDGDR